MNGFLNVSLFLYQFIINVCQTFFFDRLQAGCPRPVLATTCLLPASAGIIITVHRYLLVLIVCYSCRSLFGTGCSQGSSRVMIHFHTYILCRISFFTVCGPGCPRTVLVTACLLPASAGIMITVHRYLLL